MSVQVRLRPEAERDLTDAATWYEAQRKGLGTEFLTQVLTGVRTIAEQPAMYPVVHRATRRLLIRRFPFGIYYRLDGDVAVVIAVLHASRDPRRWKQRS